MFPVRAYVVAGLSVFTLGYCAGSCGRSETTPPSVPSLPLEQTVVAPMQQPVQPVIKLPTLEEQLIKFLRQSPPSAPFASDLTFKQDASLSQDCRGLLRDIKRCLQHYYTNIHNEAHYTYLEAKDYVKETCKEAIK